MADLSESARFAVLVLGAVALGACSGGAATSATPMAATAVQGGQSGEILDSKKIEAGGGQAMLRYTVRLDGGETVTVDEPASRYLANGAKVAVVSRDGKPYLVQR